MVRITGDEAFILAVIEVLKVILIGICISAIATIDHVWCMYNLRIHGEFTMYDNKIGRFFDKIFGTLFESLIFSSRVSYRNLEGKRPTASSNLSCTKLGQLRSSTKRRRFLNVRTVFLIFSILLSLADIVALFAISTEGKSIADKPEFSTRIEMANEVPEGSQMVWYNPHEAQLRYEYVLRRLNRMLKFKNGGEVQVDVPRRLDSNKDEKWPYALSLSEKEKYATVFATDFTIQERANYSSEMSQVTGTTENGMVLKHYRMAKRDAERKVCSGSIGGATLSDQNETATLCYTDELRNISCAGKRNEESVSFEMKCSRIRVQRFGGNIIPRNDTIWWLTNYASSSADSVGSQSFKQMNSLRAYREDQVSPSIMVVAALLTEFPSQISLVQRPFADDVGVVIVPNWLVISAVLIFSILVLLGFSASMYAAIANLVVLSSWQELLIANLLQPSDGLNRRNKKEFRCVIGKACEDSDKKFRFYIEPETNVSPVAGIRKEEVL